VNIVQVLGIIACGGYDLTPEAMEDLLEMKEGELEVVLQNPSSSIIEQDEDGDGDENDEHLTESRLEQEAAEA
jgi:hypothetical protein